MPDFCPAVCCHHFYYFYFWDKSWAYFSNKCFAISFDEAKISLVLSSPQKPELFHKRQMKFVQAALPHEENEKIQRRSCQCLLHIETILRNEVENSGGKKWWLLQHFCSCLYLFHKESLEVFLFLWLYLSKQRPLQSWPSLAKSLIASFFDFTFQLLVPSSAVSCLGPWLKVVTDSWGVSFPFGDSQLC